MNVINRLVEFDRKPVANDKLRGFVLAYGDSLTLLNLFDPDFYLNGYTVIRNDNVRRYRILDEPNSFISRALKLKRIKPQPNPGVSIESMPEILSSANDAFPLITIHREKISDEVCYIGRLDKMTEKTFTLYEIDPNAEWEGIHRYRIRDITRVDFGGGYEEALALVAKRYGGRKTGFK
jgi:hypothetical protein